MLDAIAGPDPRAPLSSFAPPGTLAGRLERDFRDVRIAWSSTAGGLPIDPRVVSVIDSCRPTFEAIGCVTQDVFPDLAETDEVFKTLRAWYFELAYGPLVDRHRSEMKDTLVWNIEEGRRVTGPQLACAERRRAAVYHGVRTFMDTYEFLALPITQVPPFDVTEPYVTSIDGTPLATYIDWMRSCYQISVLGLPAISVPAGFTTDGLPVGLQIVGRYQCDLDVLRLAHAFEQATGFWKKRPPVVERC
jgi:amidase